MGSNTCQNQWLEQSLYRPGFNLTLEPIGRWLHVLKNPHLGLPVVHVAGTNGKGGVVSAMVTAILVAAGYMERPDFTLVGITEYFFHYNRTLGIIPSRTMRSVSKGGL